MTEPAPQPPLTDDDIRWLMVLTAASLAHLWARLRRFSIQPGRHPMHHLVARDVDPSEPWLDQVPTNNSLSGVIDAVMLAESLLIDEAASLRTLDRRRICLIVQHVACGATDWSIHTRRMADKLGVQLASTVRDETNGSSLHADIYHLDGTHTEYSGRHGRPHR